ncbi:hypothetical protein WN55_07976 [Dufourea novaeangliae]|uniref:Uncharacterized protein n=1 Tax=Dufourea novaeangliae TaxID=178035 RepID=A0A154P4H9_DUFNO|nr:hypothetical protein WN55_07976 [Dufourea novaeangliae]
MTARMAVVDYGIFGGEGRPSNMVSGTHFYAELSRWTLLGVFPAVASKTPTEMDSGMGTEDKCGHGTQQRAAFTARNKGAHRPVGVPESFDFVLGSREKKASEWRGSDGNRGGQERESNGSKKIRGEKTPKLAAAPQSLPPAEHILHRSNSLTWTILHKQEHRKKRQKMDQQQDENSHTNNTTTTDVRGKLRVGVSHTIRIVEQDTCVAMVTKRMISHVMYSSSIQVGLRI